MTSNDELLEKLEIGLKAITLAINTQGDIIENLFIQLTNRIILFENEKKPEPVREDVDYEKTATNEKGNTTIGPGIIKQKNIPKVSANGKIPGGYKISGTACRYCSSPIAWPPWDKDLPKDAQRDPPIHCDADGNIKGDGRCPNL